MTALLKLARRSSFSTVSRSATSVVGEVSPLPLDRDGVVAPLVLPDEEPLVA